MVPIKYNEKQLKKMLEDYTSPRELIIGNNDLHNYIAHSPIYTLKELAPHFKNHPPGKPVDWTKENIIKAAKDCESFSQFMNLYSSAYKKAKKLDWVNEIKNLFTPSPKKFKIYTEESILAIAAKCDNYRDFTKNRPGPYQQAYQQGWVPAVKAFFKQKIIDSFNEEEVISKALDCKNIQSFVRDFPKQTEFLRTIEKYNHLMDLFKEKKEEERKAKQEEYKIKKQEKKKRGSTSKHSIRYTEQDLLDKALDFVSRKEFQDNAKPQYGACWRRGILDQACAHMKGKVNYMEEIVRSVFQEFYKVNFRNIRPHFLINPKTNRRMELDGHNEQLKIAFEYNGYHHNPNSTQYTDGVREKDELKIEICNKLGIKLYVFKSENVASLRKELAKALNIEQISSVKVLKKQVDVLSEFKKYNRKDFLKLSKKEQINIIRSYSKSHLSNRQIAGLVGLCEDSISDRLKGVSSRGNKLV